MFHQTFDAKINGKAKRIGILGEEHAYTHKELEFSRKIIQNYSNFGAEDVRKRSLLNTLLMMPVLLSYIPVSVLSSEKRSHFVDATSYEYAKLIGKRIIPLDVEIPLYKMALVPAYIAMGLVGAFFNLRLKAQKNPSQSREDVLIGGEYSESRISEWIYDVKRRDQHMAQNAVNFLTGSSRYENLLINVGMAHVPGIRRNLEQLTEGFKLVSTERCA